MGKRLAAVMLLLALAAPALAEQVTTRYFTADIPESWRVVMAPAESQGATTAIFTNAAGTTTVRFVIGPSGGADAKTIAALFADQFKAPRPPVERNGQYSFTFTEQKLPGQALVATSGDVFMVTTFTGDRKTGLAFVRRYIKSQDYADLLPR